MGADHKAALHTIARLADLQFAPRRQDQWPSLVVMTDRAVQGDAWRLADAVPAGTIICLRDYELKDRAHYATRLASACRHNNVRLMVSGDVSLAVRAGAWGVHIPEGLWKRSIQDVARARSHDLRVSTAVHSRQAARSVVIGGKALCDVAMVSPVFPTLSHPEQPVLGPLGLAGILEVLPTPAYALGGVTPGTIGRLAGLPLCGVAGIRFT
ncbi:thiamine phosphate synthase [Pyruvatibacter sp.]|uniref:thiamine phosphate synthase n=1 Tax=Pyruvatibacter sp. TaxID=1981328 RepID=UPI003267ACD3